MMWVDNGRFLTLCLVMASLFVIVQWTYITSSRAIAQASSSSSNNINHLNFQLALNGGLEPTTTLASRAALALEQMGPTFVKFGQALASRPDIVPPKLATALSTLQDKMQPFDTSLAKGIVGRELLSLSSKLLSANELEDFVSSLSVTPVATASIRQVYSGTLPNNNQKVAIKVQ